MLWRSALFIGLWWALTDGRADSWGVGSVSILAAVSLSLRLLPPVSATVSRIGLLRFVIFFFLPLNCSQFFLSNALRSTR